MSSLLSFLVLCLAIPLRMLAWESVDYSKALEGDKPILMAFVGSEWCPWSDKILQEVLTQPEFENALKESVVFVRVDFPYTGISPESEKLKEKFNIRQLPTLVLVSSKEEEIAKMGYLPLKPVEFAVHLERILHGYKKLVSRVNESDLNQMPIEEMRHLYRESYIYNLAKFKDALLSVGISRDPGTFFLLEKYSALVKAEPKKAKELREQIETKDPENKEGSILQLAVIDFHARAEVSDDTQKVLKPLKKYLREFGEQDRGNVWRVQMMIAQYLFHKKENKEDTFKAAEKAIEAAPEEAKPELRDFLSYMRENIS